MYIKNFNNITTFSVPYKGFVKKKKRFYKYVLDFIESIQGGQSAKDELLRKYTIIIQTFKPILTKH